jgi:hypothetical protein
MHLAGSFRQVSVAGLQPNAHTAAAGRSEAGRSAPARRSSPTAQRSAPVERSVVAARKKRPARAVAGLFFVAAGLLAAGAGVLVFSRSGAPLSIRQNIQERRLALTRLLPSWQEPDLAIEQAPAARSPVPPAAPQPEAPQPAHPAATSEPAPEPELIIAKDFVPSAPQAEAAAARGSREQRPVSPKPNAKAIVIPMDPEAEYFVVGRTGRSDKPTLATQRVGPNGMSFSKRLFDCKAHTFKYLSDGSSLAALNKPGPAREMTPLVDGSISDYWWRHACHKPKPPAPRQR